MRRARQGLIWLLLAAAAPAAVAQDVNEDVNEDVSQDAGHECLLEPHTELELGSPVSGTVASIEVERGDLIERDQVLVRLEARAERAAVELAEAKLEFSRRKVVRNRELFEDNYVSEYKVDEVVTEMRLAEVELRQARTMLEQRTLKSPIDGIVTDRLLSPGELVSDNEILRLVRIDPLYVEVVLPVEDFGSIEPGDTARVAPQEPVGGSYPAEVTTVDRVVDAASGTFGVRLELPNPDNAIPAGLQCRVTFDN